MRNYWIIILLLLLSLITITQALEISEVFFDGSNEWIEIYNGGDSVYTGYFTLSGAKQNPISFDIVLPPKEYVLLGDSIDGLTEEDLECIIHKELGLGFPDTKEILLHLSYGSGESTSYIINEAIINKYNNTKTSLVFSGGTWTGSTTLYGSGYFGTPCGFVGIETIIMGTGDASIDMGTGVVIEETNGEDVGSSGDQTSSIIDESEYIYQDIFISEIYPKDDDFFSEYVVITSKVSYSGALLIEGLGQGSSTKRFVVDIKEGDRVLIVDNEKYIDSSQIILPSISLTDSGETLSLKTEQGFVFDNFNYVSSEKYKAIGISGMYINPTIPPYTIPEDSCVTTLSGNILGIIETFCKPPFISKWEDTQGVVYGCTHPLQNGNTLYSQFLGSKKLCEKEIYLIDNSQDQIVEEENNITNQLSGLVISEINPYDSFWGEYVEFYCKKNCKGTVNTIGFGRGETEKLIPVSLLSGEYLVVHSGKISFPSYIKNYGIDGFSLTNGGGELFLFGQDGQVIDTVVYSGGVDGKSLYSNIDGSFTKTNDYSPGTTLEYCSVGQENEKLKILGCSISIQNKTPIMFPKKINLIASLGGKEITNANKKYTCKRTGSEQISEGQLGSCNPGYISFDSGGLLTIGLTIFDTSGKVCTTSTTINYPETEEKKPNKTNYYKGLYSKRKSKFTELKSELKKHDITVNGSGNVLFGEDNKTALQLFTGVIIIESAIPNPSGKDSEKEVLTIKNISKEKQQINKLYLKGNSGKKLLISDLLLLPGLSKVFTGTFGLTNKSTCVALLSEKNHYDTLCYTDAKDDEVKYKSDSLPTSSSFMEAIKQITQFKLKLLEDRVCVEYEKENLLCKILPYTTQEVKEYKKSNKRVPVLEKDLLKLSEQNSNYKKNNRKLRKDKEILSKTLITQKNNYKKQLGLSSELLYLRKNKLEKTFNPIYTSNGFADSYNSYKFLLGNKFKTTFGILPVESVRELTLIKQGILIFDQYDIQKVFGMLISDTKGRYDSFLQKLYIQ